VFQRPRPADQQRWHRQLTAWEEVVARFDLDKNRYEEFSYLCYVDLEDSYMLNYLDFHLGNRKPVIKDRLRNHKPFWQTLNTPDWLLDVIGTGVKVPWDADPPSIYLPNNRSALAPEYAGWMNATLLEYLEYGFISRVPDRPYCVLPLQVKDTGSKLALIYDMSPLNQYVQKASFHLEGWEEMFEYSKQAEYGIQFDLKKFYHQIDIDPEYRKFFGFAYALDCAGRTSYFQWNSIPYGYTRAPFIARALMKPLISKWRGLGGQVVVFYDDGMAVSSSKKYS